MQVTDPVANCLTKIRNASRARHPHTEVVASKLTTRVLDILKHEGFIRSYKPVGQPPKQSVKVYLKYGPDRTPAIAELRRISTPGKRRYCGVDKLPKVLSGLGRVILTTSKGVMTDEEARRQRIGGEVMCYVW